MGTQSPILSKIDTIEGKILRLIPLQDELRESAQQYLNQHAITMNEFAIRCSGVWKDAKDFMEKKRAMSRGRFLVGLSVLLSKEHICDEIMKEATGLQDRQLSVALFPKPVVRTLFKVLRAQAHRAETITRELFSKAFSPHEETVLRLFNFSNEALMQLCDEKVRGEIHSIATNNVLLDTKIETAIQNQQSRIGELVRILERFNHALLPHYEGQYKQLAAALNCPETTFQVARHGEASERLMIELIEKARELSKQHELGHIPKTSPAEKPEKHEEEQRQVQSQKEIPPPQKKVAVEQTHGGITTADGVKNCITAEQLGSLSLNDPSLFIAWAVQALERARWALNVGVKLENPLEREQIRNALSKEVRELFLSMRAFEKENPVYIAPFIDAQRLTFLNADEKERQR